MIHWVIKALDYQTGGNFAMIMIMPAPFDDDKDISEAYKNDIVKSVVLKLVYGRGGNMLFPKDGAARAEAVTIVSRLVALLESLRPEVDVTASAWLVKGGELTMSLVIENNTEKAVTINHTSGQKYDFKLFDEKGGTCTPGPPINCSSPPPAPPCCSPVKKSSFPKRLTARLIPRSARPQR